MQSPPWGDGADPFGDNGEIIQTDNTNKSFIFSKNVKGDIKYPTNNLENRCNEIQTHIEDINDQQTNASKINFP